MKKQWFYMLLCLFSISLIFLSACNSFQSKTIENDPKEVVVGEFEQSVSQKQLLIENKVNQSGEIMSSIRYYYNDRGLLIKKALSENDFFGSRDAVTTFTYDEKCRLTNENTVTTSGNNSQRINEETHYVYDEQDRIVRKDTSNISDYNDAHNYELYTYNIDGTPDSIKSFRTKTDLIFKEVTYTYGTDKVTEEEVWYDESSANSTVRRTTITEFLPSMNQPRIAYVTRQDILGESAKRTDTYTYNEHGLLTKKVMKGTTQKTIGESIQETSEETTEEYTYDKNSNKTEYRYYSTVSVSGETNNTLESRFIYTYDEDGYLIQSESLDQFGAVTTTTTYKYE